MRPSRLLPSLQLDRDCSAVDQDGHACGLRARWHLLLTPAADGGMSTAELGDTAALCGPHAVAFQDVPRLVMAVHEFEAHGGPCGFPGARWGDDACELDVITARKVAALELGLVDRG